jgi:hypothetical protein
MAHLLLSGSYHGTQSRRFPDHDFWAPKRVENRLLRRRQSLLVAVAGDAQHLVGSADGKSCDTGLQTALTGPRTWFSPPFCSLCSRRLAGKVN